MIQPDSEPSTAPYSTRTERESAATVLLTATRAVPIATSWRRPCQVCCIAAQVV